MKNEIKVNEYVRLKNGIIGTILEIKTVSTNMRGEHAYAYKLGKTKKYNSCWVEDYAIVKHSLNLEDLVQVKDIIKIHNLKGDDISFWFEIFDDKTMMDFKLGLEDKEIEILEITTKEMMESISYKVKTD